MNFTDCHESSEWVNIKKHSLVPFEFLLSIFELEDGSADALTAATAADVPQQLLPLPPLAGGVPVDRTSALSLASIKNRDNRGTSAPTTTIPNPLVNRPGATRITYIYIIHTHTHVRV